ncbi:MAG: UDP-N-acetylmuramate dehydrogenase [Oscillibacter sp.]|nr:UDP-N-acetylmuramate dehydrogenase [Oscillibacter sp.]
MPWFECFDALAAARFPELEVLREEPMEKHTTFRVGGPARRFVRPGGVGECAALLRLAEKEGWPLLVLGNGSNLLAADEGLDMLVVQTGRLTGLERTGERSVRAGAGTSLARLSSFAQRESLGGLAFAHGIPGSLGGAVCMNAGAYGGEMKQVLSRVTAWFPEEGVRELTLEELKLGYRRSVFSEKRGAVLEAEFLLEPGNPEEIAAQTAGFDRRRREKQPLEYPSAGSTFKRPEGHFAGALIEQCGLKGFRVGGAQVSEKHAGFVVNAGGASCADILALIEHIQKTVYGQTGVHLEPEVKMVP